jgi:tRNA-Thr(GGU) m(6)t(6)A37 methyltransferase TsaA
MEINYKPIGIINTPFKRKKGMPIQPAGAEGIKGTIELNPEYLNGLLDLDDFSHIYLIYHFHKSEGYKLQVKPFLDQNTHGVFATRAPNRPNPIGFSIVKLIHIEGNILEIENVDMLDGTPLLDIKPFIPAFDFYATDKTGWMNYTKENLKNIKSDNRFL